MKNMEINKPDSVCQNINQTNVQEETKVKSFSEKFFSVDIIGKVSKYSGVILLISFPSMFFFSDSSTIIYKILNLISTSSFDIFLVSFFILYIKIAYQKMQVHRRAGNNGKAMILILGSALLAWILIFTAYIALALFVMGVEG